MACEVPLTGGQIMLVDDDDYERAAAYRWRLVSGYPARTEGDQVVYAHRWLLDAPAGVEVDHINLNKLDARRSVNLRLCDSTGNKGNVAKTQKRPTSSRFKGVTLFKGRGCWEAKISINDRSRHLGLYDDEMEAALAYDQAARGHFGEFARPNFVEPTVPVVLTRRSWRWRAPRNAPPPVAIPVRRRAS